MSVDHITYYTPLQDYAGIITPTSLHFVQQHSSELPDIDPKEHRLTIHGMVDRPSIFTVDELKRLPSVSRVHFVECHGNSSAITHSADDPKMGFPPVARNDRNEPKSGQASHRDSLEFDYQRRHLNAKQKAA